MLGSEECTPPSSPALSSSSSFFFPCSALSLTGSPQMRLSAAILSFHSVLASILGGSGLEWTRRPWPELKCDAAQRL